MMSPRSSNSSNFARSCVTCFKSWKICKRSLSSKMTMNMPLLRIAIMRPATETCLSVFSPAASDTNFSLIAAAASVLSNFVMRKGLPKSSVSFSRRMARRAASSSAGALRGGSVMEWGFSHEKVVELNPAFSARQEGVGPFCSA